MIRPAVLGLVLLLHALAPTQAEHASRAVSQLEAAKVTIDPLPAGRSLVRLPGVDLALRIQPACPPDLRFESLSISVADTRRTIGIDAFATSPTIETRLQVPGRQIGPVAVGNFCLIGADTSPPTKRIADAMTATIAMRCRNGSSESVTYEALGLDIQLICAAPQTDAAAADSMPVEDQDAPSSMTRF